MRYPVSWYELHAVVYQVLQHLRELILLRKDRRQVAVFDDRALGLYRALQVFCDYK